jgi:hypothetical protein
MPRKNQVTKDAVAGDPMEQNMGAEENLSVSRPIATQEPNTARKYIEGVKKIKNIVTANADMGDPMVGVEQAPQSTALPGCSPMNSSMKCDIDESITITDSIKTLFEGSDLSADFQEKLTIIFEAAVKEKTYTMLENLEEHYNAALEEEIAELAEVMIEAIDSKLNYISEIWLAENQLAVESGIKVNIYENFMNGMKTLFQENYVDIPDERYDVLSNMNGTIEELEYKLNEQIEINSQLNELLHESIIEDTINDVGYDLSKNQKEKLKFLSEGLEFETEQQLKTKVEIIKESAFPSNSKKYTILNEEVSGDYSNISDSMSKYVSAL